MVPIPFLTLIQAFLLFFAGMTSGGSVCLWHEGLVESGREGFVGGNLWVVAVLCVLVAIWIGLPKELTVRQKIGAVVKLLLSPVGYVWWGLVYSVKEDPFKASGGPASTS